MSNYNNFAVLAPVPLRHLQSGLEVCRREGKVAFGSNAFLFFHDLDNQRAGQPVPVYFYASHYPSGKPEISWKGIFIGFYNEENIPYTNKNQYRPPTTYQPPEPDTDTWSLFWEVADLAPIPEGPARIALYNLVADKGNKKLALNFLPQGPLLIRDPGV